MLSKALTVLVATFILTVLLTLIRFFISNAKENKLALLFFVRDLNVRDVHVKGSFRLKSGGKTQEMDILISHHEITDLMSRVNRELISRNPFPNLEWQHDKGKNLIRAGLRRLTHEESSYLASNISD